ncbi:uncharacterized protein LOC107640453 [Arachis ipaensis]|uniref:uncharacterized protein LOC107640453 n=1 Tax=Arachis ipaensis TaxID=130454 RepID=UPI0007AF00AD|nr:uncharacterized protein LOC107640453 [Arachis ipaensis]
MDEELKAMEDNNTWTLTQLPPNKHTIGCRWVYKIKCKADGTVDRYRARLVAKGYTQQAGVDFRDTFSPVAKLATVRVLLSLAAIKGWSLWQMDVNNTFLNGDLFEEVYMELPLGHKDRNKGLVCKLNHVVYLLVYVDDIILASASSTMLSNVQKLLQSIFKLKILGDLKYFFGLEIAKSTDGIHLCQRKYTLNLLQDTNFTTCKPTALPMEPNLKLSSTDGTHLSDPSLYRRLVGRLMYLTISRPEITYAVNTLSQFMKSPNSSHMDALHHILRYLKGSPGQALFFPANSDIRLMAYADSDWVGCPDTRRSVAGYCTFIGNSLIS